MKALLVALTLGAMTLMAEALAPGTYKGKYDGSSGSSGDFIVKLDQSSGKWTGNVTFTLGGAEVKTTVKSLQVDGSKLKIVYDFDLQGNALESQIDGDFSGGKLTGKYRTQVVGDGSAVDEGTWSASSGG